MSIGDCLPTAYLRFSVLTMIPVLIETYIGVIATNLSRFMIDAFWILIDFKSFSNN